MLWTKDSEIGKYAPFRYPYAEFLVVEKGCAAGHLVGEPQQQAGYVPFQFELHRGL